MQLHRNARSLPPLDTRCLGDSWRAANDGYVEVALSAAEQELVQDLEGVAQRIEGWPAEDAAANSAAVAAMPSPGKLMTSSTLARPTISRRATPAVSEDASPPHLVASESYATERARAATSSRLVAEASSSDADDADAQMHSEVEEVDQRHPLLLPWWGRDDWW